MGGVAAALCLTLYAIALGFFLALTLLVASMEEGGGNLSQSAPELTQAIILLSQGTGFAAGALTITITPLLLTGLLIALLAALVQRLHATTWRAYLTGVVLWEIIMLMMANSLALPLTDPLWLVAIKSLVVCSLGFLVAALPKSPLLGAFRIWWHDRVSARLRDALQTGVVLGLGLLASYLIIGVLTVCFWAVANHSAMGRLFQLTGMHTGSRILTTICSLAWLPNLCLWALSWVFGGGFAIGDLATFTLWTGQSTSLPPLPIFGLLPRAVADARLQTALVMLPVLIAVSLGLLALLLPRGFAIRAVSPDKPRQRLFDELVNMAYAAGAFCLASIILTLSMTLLFQVSNGALGQHRLSHLGVDVMASTRTLGHPSALGLFLAWMLVAISVAGWYGVRLLVRHIRTRAATRAEADQLHHSNADHANTGHLNTEDTDSHNRKAREPRRLTSDPKTVEPGSSSNTRVIISLAQSKEEHDGDNTTTDTTGSRFRLS